MCQHTHPQPPDQRKHHALKQNREKWRKSGLLGVQQQKIAIVETAEEKRRNDIANTERDIDAMTKKLADHNRLLDKIIKRQAKPRLLHTMPFGKHAGMVLSQVPLEYRRWLMNAGNLDKDLAYSLRKLDPQ